MFGIVGSWLLVVLLALVWTAPGTGPASILNFDGAALVGIDMAPGDTLDGPEPPLHSPDDDEGEVEPDYDVIVVRHASLPVLPAARQSILAGNQPCGRVISAYMSQAPPLA